MNDLEELASMWIASLLARSQQHTTTGTSKHIHMIERLLKNTKALVRESVQATVAVSSFRYFEASGVQMG